MTKFLATKILLTTFLVSILSHNVYSQVTETREDLKKFYDDYNVEGLFVLYNQNNDKFIFHNEPQFKEQFTPASTFKICNSLIGIETGVIKDENYVLQWDSVVRRIPEWNKDQDLKTAFKNSTVWYYQELARRVGVVIIKYWLDKVNYGNADTSGGIDQFWLEGGLRISAEQQINFLRRLHDNELPFSQRSMDIVKKIMIAKESSEYVVRAKTGWGFQDHTNIGWYVGYVETNNNVFYFANCIRTKDDIPDFGKARIDIVYQILEELKVINK